MIKFFIFIYNLNNIFSNLRKKHFIIHYKIENRIGGYSLFEILIDLVILLHYLIFHPTLFIKYFISIFFCFIFFSFLPLLFLLIYVISFFSLSLFICICILFNKNYIIHFSEITFDPSESFVYLFINLSKYLINTL
jgi:hypothetical protein